MCGISGVVGNEKSALEACKIASDQSWRGTSSTGVAWIIDGHINVMKNLLPPTAFLKKHEHELEQIPVKIAIGHNRWPSVGEVSRNNAHPFVACDGSFALVHNGTGTIPKKFIKQLADMGHKFQGETDSEVMTHAIEELRKLTPDWVKVLRGFYDAFNHIEGFAILILTQEGEIWGIRNQYPIEIAQYENQVFIASCEGGLAELNGKKVKLMEPRAGTVFQVKGDGGVQFWGKFDKEEKTIEKEPEYKTVWSEWGAYNYDSEGWQRWSQNQHYTKVTERQVDELMDEWMEQNNKKQALKKLPKLPSSKPVWDVCNVCHKEYWVPQGHMCNGEWERKPLSNDYSKYFWCDKCEAYDQLSHANLHSGKNVSPIKSREELFEKEKESIEVEDERDPYGWIWKWNPMKGQFERKRVE